MSKFIVEYNGTPSVSHTIIAQNTDNEIKLLRQVAKLSFNPAYKPVRLYICKCQLVGKFIGLLRRN